MHRRLASHTFILGIACLLSACGFQLRGTGDGSTVVPDAWKSMHLITGNPNGEFSRGVQTLFAANGVQWLDREDANYTLTLGPERFSQRNLSLNAEARVAEFELTMRARFSVRDADNNEVMPTADASVVRQMENDPRNVVGKAEEVRILRSEMRTELAQQIMRRIGFFAASTQ
jgi:LPS-assembly lipoprotein